MQRSHHLTKTRGNAEISSLNENKREVTKRIPFSPSYSFSVNAGVLNVCEVKKLLLVVQNKACVCECTLFAFSPYPSIYLSSWLNICGIVWETFVSPSGVFKCFSTPLGCQPGVPGGCQFRLSRCLWFVLSGAPQEPNLYFFSRAQLVCGVLLK